MPLANIFSRVGDILASAESLVYARCVSKSAALSFKGTVAQFKEYMATYAYVFPREHRLVNFTKENVRVQKVRMRIERG